MRWVIVRVSRGRTAWADTATEDYLQRIRRSCPVEEKVLMPDTALGRVEGTALDLLRDRESQRVWAMVQPRDWVIALDERGKSLTTEVFSQQLARIAVEGSKRVLFLLGGPYGHAGWLRERANLVMSLSSFVLNHEVARVVLLEQLYRVLALQRGDPYHHV